MPAVNSAVKTRPGEAAGIFYALCMAAAIFILVSLKGSDRLLHAGIWAEDGKVFLKQAFELGWTSLLRPYDGYFHTVPRLIALAVSWLPVAYIPTAIVVTCYAVYGWAVSLVLGSPYRWLFPRRAFALICALLLLLSPGQIVMLGNATNLHWYLLLILAIYGLKDIRQTYSKTELTVAFLCIASEGAALILMPLYLTRIVLKKNRPRVDSRGEYVILFFLVLFAVIHFSLSESALYGSSQGLSSYAGIFINHLYYFFILHVFTGDTLLPMIPEHKVVMKSVAFCLVLCLLFLLSKKWRGEYLLIVVLSLCSLLLPVMIALARPQNYGIVTNYFNYDTYDWFRFRYSFFVPAIASIFWCFIISRLNKPAWLPIALAGVILCAQIYGGRYRLAIDRYEETGDWYNKAPLLEESLARGCPSSVRVEISPPGWSVDFNTAAAADCSENRAR